MLDVGFEARRRVAGADFGEAEVGEDAEPEPGGNESSVKGMRR